METIFITGASSGIGKETAIALAKQFSNNNKSLSLFLTAKDKTKLLTTKQECLKYNAKVKTYPCNLSSIKAISKAYQTCIATFNNIHGFIHSAGIGIFKNFQTITESEFDSIVNINLKATFFLTQLIMNSMMLRKSGTIIFITSVAAEKPFAQSSIYCMTKFGQKGLIDVLRIYARNNGIRITNIMPGAVLTPMWNNSKITDKDKMLTPEDIARTIVECYSQPPNASIEEITIRHKIGDLQDFAPEI